jgi:hypothetical protein
VEARLIDPSLIAMTIHINNETVQEIYLPSIPRIGETIRVMKAGISKIYESYKVKNIVYLIIKNEDRNGWLIAVHCEVSMKCTHTACQSKECNEEKLV